MSAALNGIKVGLERENNALIGMEFAFGNALDVVLRVVRERVEHTTSTEERVLEVSHEQPTVWFPLSSAQQEVAEEEWTEIAWTGTWRVSPPQ